MEWYSVIRQKGVILLCVGILIPYLTVTAQSGNEQTTTSQQVQFTIQGKTRMANSAKPKLMLNIVEELEASPHLVHLKIGTTQRVSVQKKRKTSGTETKFNAELAFDRYKAFRSWFDSDSTERMLENLRNRFDQLHVELQLIKQ